MKKILIVEDEEFIRIALEDDFSLEGYNVEVAADGATGLQKALAADIDLIILDIMLPEINGFDICRKLRNQGITTPIIMLTAKGQEIDRVAGLEMGADDYITKPFSPRELQARVRAILRRMEQNTTSTASGISTYGNLKLDFSGYTCHKNGKEIKLTTHEFDLLRYLVKNKGKVVTRDELIDHVWGDDVIIGSGTINTHIGNLRKKIEENINDPKLIVSVRGVGYKFLG